VLTNYFCHFKRTDPTVCKGLRPYQGTLRSKLKYAEPLSDCAYNFNSRPYTVVRQFLSKCWNFLPERRFQNVFLMMEEWKTLLDNLARG